MIAAVIQVVLTIVKIFVMIINFLSFNDSQAGRNFDPDEEERVVRCLGIDMEANILYNK